MSVILRGLGLDVDSMSSIVAYGLTRDLVGDVPIVDDIDGATIDQLFVIDFGGARPMTAAEWRRWRALMDRIRTCKVKARRVRKHKAAPEEVFFSWR
jgi:hypothetical protein